MLDFYYEQHQARTPYVSNRRQKFENAEHSIQSDLGFSTRQPNTTTASDDVSSVWCEKMHLAHVLESSFKVTSSGRRTLLPFDVSEMTAMRCTTAHLFDACSIPKIE